MRLIAVLRADARQLMGIWSIRGGAENRAEIGSAEEALNAHQKALAIRKQLVEARPSDAEHRNDLAKSCTSVASLQRQMGQQDDAIASCQEAIDILKSLVAEGPDVSAHHTGLAGAYGLLADLHRDNGKYKEAIAVCEQAVEIYTALVIKDPHNLDFSFDLASWLNTFGAMNTYGPREQRAASCEKAIEILEKLKGRAPSDAKYQHLLAACYNNLARWQPGADEKLKWFDKAIEIERELVKQNPLVTRRQADVRNG